MIRRIVAIIVAVTVLCTGFIAAQAEEALPMIDMGAWQYNEADDVYWQVGLSYAATSADADYETMGIFIPGAYFEAIDNGDGTYTCAVNPDGAVGAYTAQTAPFVIPVNTPGYMAMSAPTGYESSTGYGNVADYAGEGIIVLFAGARGRDAGAPAGVTDFKAAIRYARYNADLLPGDMDSIFSMGMSGGGAQSALLGATGDSALYDPYLEAIGAVMTESDAVKGSMCWCPITNLDMADEAYEWNMGNTRSGLSEENQAYSDGMALAFAEYINALGLMDEAGNALTLEESAEGIYQAGSYYDTIKSAVETSLNNFLLDTEFPYTVSSGKGGSGGMGSGRGGLGGQMPDLGTLGDGDRPIIDLDGELPEGMEGMKGDFGGRGGFGDMGDGEGTDYEAMDGIARGETTSSGVSLSGTYDTVQDYIDALNANGEWVIYDADSNTATITSVADFTMALKPASKSIAAFDQLDGGQGENTLFGYGDGSGAHFDPILAALAADSDYAEAFAADLAREDALGNTVDVRVNMYNPMYYLSPWYEGYQTSKPARFWRIRTGINQGDTALCTEINLALAARNYSEETEVDFATVWGQGHTEAERTGDSTQNYIAWVNECMGK